MSPGRISSAGVEAGVGPFLGPEKTGREQATSSRARKLGDILGCHFIGTGHHFHCSDRPPCLSLTKGRQGRQTLLDSRPWLPIRYRVYGDGWLKLFEEMSRSADSRFPVEIAVWFDVDDWFSDGPATIRSQRLHEPCDGVHHGAT